MIKVYTNYKGELMHIKNPDAYFDAHIGLRMFDDTCIRILKEIDRAEICDVNTNAVKTPYGVTSVQNISTGCKAAILCYLLHEKGIKSVVTINNCGYNAMSVIFGTLKDKDFIVELHHRAIPSDIDINVYIDDKYICKNTDEVKLRLKEII